ncbi:MAG: hypothetical protein K6T83_22200 [Alicyclobacillus sp.]|nr:hypothetical protein [Alicyclobacillus sp.]
MFRFDSRLGIELPDFPRPFEDMPQADQEEDLVRWETIRARIPEQIMKFEAIIEDLLQQVHHEEDWDIIAAHFAQISDFASRINELNTWRRVDQSLHQHAEITAEHRDREK